MLVRKLWVAILGMVALPAYALDYRTVSGKHAILYDAPSERAKPLFVLSKNYPLAIVVSLGEWVKVRDITGALAWIEKKNLADKRMVLIATPVAEIRRTPTANAPLLFRAEKNVLLELLEYTGDGWVKVRHPDGQTGFVPIGQVWGA